jgi:alkyl sulfatase BDS1-like metallo-beta-lactamase superfamily hydrolase
VQGRHESSAAATLTMERMTLVDIVTQQTTFMDQVNEGNITVDGDASALLTIFGNLDVFTPGFHIVEP